MSLIFTVQSSRVDSISTKGSLCSSRSFCSSFVNYHEVAATHWHLQAPLPVLTLALFLPQLRLLSPWKSSTPQSPPRGLESTLPNACWCWYFGHFLWNMHVFVFLRFYLFLEKGEGRDKKRDRNVDVREKHRLVASCTSPDWEPNPKPRCVPWLEIELVTFHFAGWCPAHWVTAVRAHALEWWLLSRRFSIHFAQIHQRNHYWWQLQPYKMYFFHNKTWKSKLLLDPWAAE